MPRAIHKGSVTSLFSMSVECVVSNLLLYKGSLQYLPKHGKERILRKFLTKCSAWENSVSNEIMSRLVYPQLKCINLSSININNDTLNILETCHSLTEVNLRNCGNQNVTSESLKSLFQQTKNLLVLDVSHCKSFNDYVLVCLSQSCRNLRELCAEGCSLTDDGFMQLTQNNRKLKCLTISDTEISGEGICNATKSRNCLHLQELRLDNCPKVDDEVLKTVIHHCPKIEILTFYNCPITDETSIFQDITMTCKNLKQLHWTITW